MEDRQYIYRDIAGMMDELSARLLVVQRCVNRRRNNKDADRLAVEATEGLLTAMEELKVAQEELRNARDDAENQRERYQDLFEFAPDGYIVSDARGYILEANRAASEMLCVPYPYIIGKPLTPYVHKDSRSELFRVLRSMRNEARGQWTLRISPRQREPIVVDVTTAAAVYNGELTMRIRWLFRDVTDQKRSESEVLASRAQLRSMSAQLSLAEEQERRRIATDIHDNISQNLAASNLQLGLLRSSLSGEQLAAVDEVRATLAQTIRQSRTLTFELSPSILYELGLGPALQWLIEQKRNSGVVFAFSDDQKSKPLREELNVLLFQAVRELLINAVKHAAARRGAVHLMRDGADVKVIVEDDGIGFDASRELRQTAEGGFGLLNVRERLEHLGGSMTIESKRGQGTRIALKAPLNVRKRRKASHERETITGG